MCSKDESLSSCIKSRNPLGVIVLVLLFISGAFIYTAYYITSASSQKTTEKPISKVLGDFISSLSQVDWCLNTTAPQEFDRSEFEIIEQPDTNNISTSTSSVITEVHDASLINYSYSACLELIVVIPGDYYPSFKNKSIYRGSISRHKLFSEEFNSVGSEETINFVYSVQHNQSTSMRHSRDVLIPTYINISSAQPLPPYIRDQSSCKLTIEDAYDNSTSLVTSCKKAAPKFHIDQSWESDIHVYISVDEGRLNIHLLYTSYFLMILAITVTAYSMIKNRNSNSKNNIKGKMQQHFVIY